MYLSLQFDDMPGLGVYSQADGQRPQQSLGSVTVSPTPGHNPNIALSLSVVSHYHYHYWDVIWMVSVMGTQALSGDNLFVVCLLPNDRTHSANEMQILLTLKH